MKIASITMSGFRCFGPEPTTIDLENLTIYVGPNSSGKTAAMLALVRIFGESSGLRRIRASDFYLQTKESLKEKGSRSLYIECRLVFPELESKDCTTGNAIPESFNQMIVDRPNGTPYCRVRLEATWTNDGTLLGDVEQKIDWILTDSNDSNVIDNNRRKLLATDRAKIRVIYVPAVRDPKLQVRGTNATVFSNLISSLEWGATESEIKGQLSEIQSRLSSLLGIQTLNYQLQKSWEQIYLGHVARKVQFQGIEDDPTTLLEKLTASFDSGEDGQVFTTDELSDGLRSLFSLSLSLCLFQVEQKIATNSTEFGFGADISDRLPLMTVFAVEEPENHLSPHYLGHVIRNLGETAKSMNAQVVLSSHSPSILARVEPDIVRYFRGDEHSPATSVIPLPLPQDEQDEAFKFVREAIRGYPELYFASLVILGEGPSEEIVLKHVFEAHGTPLDSNFISIVPLGGRHVNHFWKLLHSLKIPYLTLLDLDKEKEGAGWGRIQYVRNQLVRLHGAESEQIKYTDANSTIVSLADSRFDHLGQNDISDTNSMNAWIGYFQAYHNVFFSEPLDIDLSLLEAFPETYKGLIVPPQRGPQLPNPWSNDYKESISGRVKQVLSADAANAPNDLGHTYSDAQRELFAWYQYLFISGSKPVNHMRAMIAIEPETLIDRLPKTLKDLVAKARTFSVIQARDVQDAAN